MQELKYSDVVWEYTQERGGGEGIVLRARLQGQALPRKTHYRMPLHARASLQPRTLQQYCGSARWFRPGSISCHRLIRVKF
jgi:hypothetical protein